MKHGLRGIILSGLMASLLSANVIYKVAVNTNDYIGRSGYLDFQLGSGPDSQRAAVAIQNFSTDGVLNDADRQIRGGVTGTLPGVVALTNSQQLNDYFAGFTYGRLATFTLDFSGPAITEPTGASTYGSPFYFGLYDDTQTPIGSSDAFGNALLIQINANGTTTTQVYNNAVSVTSTVPEPGILSLLGIGFAMTTLKLKLLQKR